jgi:predicted anti-sigma-YlaC factor YlaD
MNAMRCRYESETIRAFHHGELQPGACSEALIQHQKECPVCREAVVVAQALRRDAEELAARYTPPPSAQILAAAERHRRMESLARATRFFRVLKIAGMVYAAVFVLWGLHSLTGHGGVVLPGLDGKSLNATLEGAGLAAIFVGSGLWYALRRDERRMG